MRRVLQRFNGRTRGESGPGTGRTAREQLFTEISFRAGKEHPLDIRAATNYRQLLALDVSHNKPREYVFSVAADVNQIRANNGPAAKSIFFKTKSRSTLKERPCLFSIDFRGFFTMFDWRFMRDWKRSLSSLLSGACGW